MQPRRRQYVMLRYVIKRCDVMCIVTVAEDALQILVVTSVAQSQKLKPLACIHILAASKITCNMPKHVKRIYSASHCSILLIVNRKTTVTTALCDDLNYRSVTNASVGLLKLSFGIMAK